MKLEQSKDFWSELNDRNLKGKQLIKQGHLTECYKVAYPDDPEVYCTCLTSNYPD